MGCNVLTFISDFIYIVSFFLNLAKHLSIFCSFKKTNSWFHWFFSFHVCSNLYYFLPLLALGLVFLFQVPCCPILWSLSIMFSWFPRAAVRVTANRTRAKTITLVRSSQPAGRATSEHAWDPVRSGTHRVPPEAPASGGGASTMEGGTALWDSHVTVSPTPSSSRHGGPSTALG